MGIQYTWLVKAGRKQPTAAKEDFRINETICCSVKVSSFRDVSNCARDSHAKSGGLRPRPIS